MKALISYPPLNTAKGIPLLSQNRQFQYFKKPTFIYPVVPATAATLLKKAGYDVLWNDCIAGGFGYSVANHCPPAGGRSLDEFYDFIVKEKPDLIALETKTPVIQEHWRIIDNLKRLETGDWRLATILFGDHVTALPEESFQNSRVDYVLTGGDYDFLLLNLCDYLSGRRNTDDGRQMSLEPGIYYRENGQIKNTGKFRLNHDLDGLPFIDRDLTQWQNYAYENGNYKRTPGTYIMSSRDCWWAKCTFCSWPVMYNRFRSRSVQNVLDEIGSLINGYSVKEIMDDSGTFPAGEWLKDFCQGMIERGYSKKINFDCNMRFGALSESEYRLMKKAGFRLLLFGLESASQNTLDRINKNIKVQEIIDSCKLARICGLYPHITIMFGYPWESYEDALKTMKLGQWLLKKGYAYTMQATVVIPYPGSPLFEECRVNNWLKTRDWKRYDMKEPVMLGELSDEKIMKLVRSLYGIALNPEFIVNRLLSVSSFEDISFFLRSIPRIFGHIFDFSHKPEGDGLASDSQSHKPEGDGLASDSQSHKLGRRTECSGN